MVSETRRIYSDAASTQAEAFTTQWSYNSADLPVTTTYPDGETLAIEYDRQGKPLTMANTNAFTYVRDVLYDEAGRMTHLELGDTGSEAVIQRNYSYYPWDQSVQGGRMSSLTSLNAASATLQSLAYTYDAAGNLTQISDERADETSTFSYDGLDRLTGMSVLNDLSETVHSEVFTYDEAGRMSAKGPDAQSLSAFSYDPQHPHAVNGLGSNTYSYDNNGNQVTRNLADLQYELSYDAENHLVDVDSSLAPSPTPTATPTTTPTATLYSIYLPMVVVVPNNATPTPAATANPTTPATPAATATPTPEITPTATSVIAYPMLPQEESQTPVGRQPQQTPKPAPQATPAPETANPSARGANTHPLQLPPNRPALAQDPTQEPSPTPTATPETVQANYLYDGDGNLARGIVNGVVTFYPGRHYNREVDGANVTVKKFYTLGSSTIAVRTVQGSNDTLNWILSDHLGSASVTANADGTWNSEIKYTAFGEVRASYGLTPTDYRYTGQLDVAELGLIYFVARFYDPVLTHFVQADTLVPNAGDSASYDRYAYTLNNPIRYSDPSGHAADAGGGAATMGPDFWFMRKYKPTSYSSIRLPSAQTIDKSLTLLKMGLDLSAHQLKKQSVKISESSFVKKVFTPEVIRGISRASDEIAPPLMVFTWGLNVIPNQIDNVRNFELSNECIAEMSADYVVDNIGFWAPEIIGNLFGIGVIALTHNIGLGIVSATGSDLSAGYFYDKNYSSTLRVVFTDFFIEGLTIHIHPSSAQPVPTPPQSERGTPMPPKRH